MRETQQSICAWANEAFGPAPGIFCILTRANEELAELLRAIAAKQPNERIVEECADVAIVLVRVADRLDLDLRLDWSRLSDTVGYGGFDAVRANYQIASALIDAESIDRGVPAETSLRERLQKIVGGLVIVCRFYGGSLDEAIDRKMAVNRERVWKRDGTGHGYHMRDKSAGEVAP